MGQSKLIPLDPAKRPFRILSIDGGGVRGVIPLRILREIEERTGKPISHLFDLIVGNSTGGIIALCLACGESRLPKYSAKQVLDIYYTRSSEIFAKSFLRPFYTGFGLFAAKYDRTHLDKVLEEFFSNTMRLGHVVCPAIVTSYSLTRDTLSLWTSYRAQKDPSVNILMKDAAGATSAAPTYFSPKKVLFPNGTTSYEADGGIYANDPEEIAVTEALLQNPGLHPEQIFMLSLGTGQPKLTKSTGQKLHNTGALGWFLQANLIDLMLNADTQLEEFQTESISLFQRYRMQFNLDPKNTAMDNAKHENLNVLLQVAEKFIHTSPDEISRICTFLTQKINVHE